MRDLIAARSRLMEDVRITLFGRVRGNGRDFERILRSYLTTRGAVTRMKKDQAGDFHVAGETMFKLVAYEDDINSALGAAQGRSSGMFTIVKRYASWVPGFLDDVVKEQ